MRSAQCAPRNGQNASPAGRSSRSPRTSSCSRTARSRAGPGTKARSSGSSKRSRRSSCSRSFARAKFNVAAILGSRALRADSLLTMFGAALACVSCIALVLVQVAGWWWSDAVGALVIATLLLGEATRTLARAAELSRGRAPARTPGAPCCTCSHPARRAASSPTSSIATCSMNRVGAAPCRILSRLEEHAIARADHLDRPATPLAEPEPLAHPDRLTIRVRVPRGPRTGLKCTLLALIHEGAVRGRRRRRRRRLRDPSLGPARSRAAPRDLHRSTPIRRLQVSSTRRSGRARPASGSAPRRAPRARRRRSSAGTPHRSSTRRFLAGRHEVDRLDRPLLRERELDECDREVEEEAKDDERQVDEHGDERSSSISTRACRLRRTSRGVVGIGRALAHAQLDEVDLPVRSVR